MSPSPSPCPTKKSVEQPQLPDKGTKTPEVLESGRWQGQDVMPAYSTVPLGDQSGPGLWHRGPVTSYLSSKGRHQFKHENRANTSVSSCYQKTLAAGQLLLGKATRPLPGTVSVLHVGPFPSSGHVERTYGEDGWKEEDELLKGAGPTKSSACGRTCSADAGRAEASSGPGVAEFRFCALSR